jgi:hypothetical protein
MDFIFSSFVNLLAALPMAVPVNRIDRNANWQRSTPSTSKKKLN